MEKLFQNKMIILVAIKMVTILLPKIFNKDIFELFFNVYIMHEIYSKLVKFDVANKAKIL